MADDEGLDAEIAELEAKLQALRLRRGAKARFGRALCMPTRSASIC